MRFKEFLLAVSLTVTMATGASAALVDAPVDASEYLTIGTADWAWAGPCSAVAPSCGPIDLSYQGALGWAVATTSQLDGVIGSSGGLASFVALFSGGDVCASRFFSTSYSHCDYSDGSAGYIYNYSGNPLPGASFLETFAIRVSDVPIPASLPLLLGGFGLLGAMKRRKKT